MTVARRYESRLTSLNLLMALSLQNISKMWSALFCAVNITEDIENFFQISVYEIKPKLMKSERILYIIKSTKKAYHILEIQS